MYAKEIEEGHVKTIKDEDLESAIVIERGNFYYGVEKESKVDKYDKKSKKKDR